VIPACDVNIDGSRVFFSHRGSTFGGIILSKNEYSASKVDEIFQLLEAYLKEQGFQKIFMKQTCELYQRENANLIDYFYFQKNYNQYNELNYFLKLEKYQNDIATVFSSSKRRDYKYSLKNNLQFKVLDTPELISEFFDVLQLNLKKLGLNSVHSYEELLDLKFNRFNDEIEFYGVYHENKIIAGSMLFYFNDEIVHTQYLSSDETYLKMFPMDFLIYNLIDVAIQKQKKIFTFGICTEERGKYINLGLSRFKEGFGCEFVINKSFEKEL